MPDVVIMTDSNTGMTQEEGKRYGVEILPMSFIINGKIYYEGIDISHEEFFQKLGEDAQVSTSQPAPGEVIERWETLLKRHDEVVYIPMSGALSKSCETARMLAEDYNGRVQVVDSRRVSVPDSASHNTFRDELCNGSVSSVQAPNASTTTSKPFRSKAVRSSTSLLIYRGAAERFSPRTTAVTSRPRCKASFVISCPTLPFAHTTAIFILNTSMFYFLL